MLTILFFVLLALFLWKGGMLAIRAAWGMIKVCLVLVVIPVGLVVLVIIGLVKFALPILAVVGLITLLRGGKLTAD